MNRLWFWFHDDVSLEWLSVDAGGLNDQGICNHFELTHLPTYRQAQSVILLLTSQDFYVREVDLFERKISYLKAQEILPLMLEDDLLDELESMRCFPLSMSKHKAQVVIFSSEVWQKTTDLLEEANINCHKIFPLVALLPNWTCVDLSPLILVKTPKCGFSAPEDRISIFLDHTISSLEEKPGIIHWDGLEIPDFNIPVPWERLQRPWWEVINQKLPELPHDMSELVDLNQEQRGGDAFIFYNLGVLILIMITISFGFKLDYYHELNQNKLTTQNEIETLYLELYPKAQSVVAPKVRMERELSENTGVDNNPFFLLMQKIGSVSQTSDGLKIQSMEYDNSVMRMRIEASDYTALQTFMLGLEKTVKVEQKTTVQQGDFVSSHIEVSL